MSITYPPEMLPAADGPADVIVCSSAFCPGRASPERTEAIRDAVMVAFGCTKVDHRSIRRLQEAAAQITRFVEGALDRTATNSSRERLTMNITDDMLRAALKAMEPDRIQGFSTPSADRRTWGPPHYVLDVFRTGPERELWRGDSAEELEERCEMERLRLGIKAALARAASTRTEP
ncbi:MAG TPA: hypothetical protein VEA41_20720 [Salinarimonas sp.]|nr:hypothetical protein [Salinarimonas sp.]